MFRFLVSLLAGGCWVVMTAASGSIGVIRSVGDFRVDGSMVRGNGTVFNGDTIETTTSRSYVQLAAVQITLGPDSRAKVYRDRTVLEKGAGLLRDADGHVFEAASLRIAPEAGDSIVQVDVKGPNRISVAARSGGASVRNSGGLLVANLRAGTELEFDAQAGAAMAVELTGKVEMRDGNYFITDVTAKVTTQLQGANLARYVGKVVRVQGSLIQGAQPAGGATGVIRVVAIDVKAGAAATTGAVAGGAAGGAGSAGLSTAAVGAIVGGVGVAATVGGLAAAGTFSSPTPVSHE